MRAGWFSTGLIAAFLTGAPALAQNLRDIPGPREAPPASFRGAQYVDSGGCVFVKAGVDGRVIWVPRVNAARKVICGYPPTFPATVAADAPAIVPELPEPGEAATRPVAAATPQPGGAPGAVRPVAAACPADAPLATRADLRGGGSVVLCLPRDGRLTRAASIASVRGATPLAAQAQGGSVLVCPRAAPVAQRIALSAGGSTLLCTPGDGSLSPLAVPRRKAAIALATAPAAPLRVTVSQPRPQELLRPEVPPGYKLAWKDDRLNPLRAKGTAAGQAAQDRIWTREVPARLVAEAVAGTGAVTMHEARVRVSTKGIPAGQYVQVGSFGDPGNAAAARTRLAALGLPVGGAALRSGGRQLEVVMAGPFASDEAQAALATVRANGFPDALIR